MFNRKKILNFKSRSCWISVKKGKISTFIVAIIALNGENKENVVEEMISHNQNMYICMYVLPFRKEMKRASRPTIELLKFNSSVDFR